MGGKVGSFKIQRLLVKLSPDGMKCNGADGTVAACTCACTSSTCVDRTTIV